MPGVFEQSLSDLYDTESGFLNHIYEFYVAPAVSYNVVRDPQRAGFSTESFVAVRAIESPIQQLQIFKPGPTLYINN